MLSPTRSQCPQAMKMWATEEQNTLTPNAEVCEHCHLVTLSELTANNISLLMKLEKNTRQLGIAHSSRKVCLKQGDNYILHSVK